MKSILMYGAGILLVSAPAAAERLDIVLATPDGDQLLSELLSLEEGEKEDEDEIDSSAAAITDEADVAADTTDDGKSPVPPASAPPAYTGRDDQQRIAYLERQLAELSNAFQTLVAGQATEPPQKENQRLRDELAEIKAKLARAEERLATSPKIKEIIKSRVKWI